MKKEKCKICDGDGFTAEHDPTDTRPEHYEQGDCITCPVQVQCENCQGTGELLKD